MFKLKRYKYSILRRLTQLTLFFLFFAGSHFGWEIITGNYSSAKLFSLIPLSDPYAIIQILCSGFIVSSTSLIGALIVLAVYSIFGNRTFCGWVCPFSLITDLANWLRLKSNFSGFSISGIKNNTRYYILLLSLVISAIVGVAAFELISPIGIFHRAIIFGIGASWSVICSFFLFEFLVVNINWCSHLCPLGAFYALVGRFGFIKVEHELDSCTNCLKCFEVCPEVQVLDIVGNKSGYIQSSECINCGKCIEICEDNALKFSRNYKNIN